VFAVGRLDDDGAQDAISRLGAAVFVGTNPDERDGDVVVVGWGALAWVSHTFDDHFVEVPLPMLPGPVTVKLCHLSFSFLNGHILFLVPLQQRGMTVVLQVGRATAGRGVKIFEEGDRGVPLRGRDLRLCCCASRSVILGAIFPAKELHTIYIFICYMPSSHIVYFDIIVYIPLSIRNPTLLPPLCRNGAQHRNLRSNE
jgi:hypothetical protein